MVERQISTEIDVEQCGKGKNCKSEYVFPTMETTSSIKLLKMTEKDDKEEKEVEMYWKEEQTSVACYGMNAKFLTPFHIYILEQIFLSMELL